MELYLFFFVAIFTILSALLVILQKDPVYSVIFLIVTLICTAGLFLMLNAELIAVLQVLIYAGAIMVLFLFVIMMLSLSKEKPALRTQKLFGWVASSIFLVLLGKLFLSVAYSHEPSGEVVTSTIAALSERLFTFYVLPVQIAGVLLLIAIVGAVILTQSKNDQE